MPNHFERAIADLDTRDPRYFQDARANIMAEINRDPRCAQQIVDNINNVEMSPRHGHQQVQLVQDRQGYLDVAPLNYGQNYSQNQPYEGGYYAPQQPPPPPYVEQRRGIDAGSLAVGVVGGVILDKLLGGGHHEHYDNRYRRQGW